MVREFNSLLFTQLLLDAEQNYRDMLAGCAYFPKFDDIIGFLPVPSGGLHYIEGPIKYTDKNNEILIFMMQFHTGHYIKMSYSNISSWQVRLCEKEYYENFGDY